MASHPESFRPDFEVDARASARIEREILIDLAGPAAEERFTGRRSIGSTGDYRNAVNMADRLHGNSKVLEAWLAYMVERTRVFIGHPLQWIRVEALAAALIVTPHIGARRARDICNEAFQDDARLRALSKRAVAEA